MTEAPRRHKNKLLARIGLALSLLCGAAVLCGTVPVDVSHTNSATAAGPTISIDAGAAGTPVDVSHFVGTNAASWYSDHLVNGTLLNRTRAAGHGLLRILGGAWSQEYGWLSCEMGQDVAGAYPCKDFTHARPSDFITFLQATGRAAMYTVNINTTAQEAAALVAFFNADVSDPTPIGNDVRGTDWKTAGHWAQLRASHGHSDPIGIKLWDFGNETYGGVLTNGQKDCHAADDPQQPGWEETWTCAGTQYVHGIGGGANRHEGYLEFRAAMRAVDPEILLGVVGYSDPAAYSNWGNEVIAAGGDQIDFYTVHVYPYYFFPPNSAAGYAEILALPQTLWPGIRSANQAAFDANAGGRNIPIWVTEYNLGNPDQDNDQLITRMIAGLFIADSIGQMMTQGFDSAMQWDLLGWDQASGTNLGLLNQNAAYRRSPQYYALPLWSRFGARQLPTTSTMDAAQQLSVYGGRAGDTTYTLLAINKTDQPIVATLHIADAAGTLTIQGGSADVVQAETLAAQNVTYNNVGDPSDDLANAPSLPLASAGEAPSYTFSPRSITLLRLQVDRPSALGCCQLLLPLIHR